jgi:NAD(P)-dependent dehydrogenase (short-subunit alcohol dehydrogenase family)
VQGLEGKRLLVGGGGSGIGAESAVRLATEGASVCIGDLSLERADAVVARIRDMGGTAFSLEYDQADEASIAELVAKAVGQLGGLNGLLANAADLSDATLGRDRQLLKMQTDVWERTLQVNLIGTALLVREALPQLLASAGGAAIVATSSSVASTGDPSRPAYAASKAGINALIRHVATKFGKDGLRANAVAPGLILSDTARELAEDWFLRKSLDAVRSDRLGEPRDVASVVAFLLSDESSWINGQVWGVDGGLDLRQ